MGVSGSGKSTIGRLLAEKLGVDFYDGDDYHPKANVIKMKQGRPLNDSDREGWLDRLNLVATEHAEEGAVIACSALKKKYRKRLGKGIEDHVVFIYLEGSFKLISNRLAQRKGHFMPPDLLRSQFHALQVPENAISISIEHSPAYIVDLILKELRVPI